MGYAPYSPMGYTPAVTASDAYSLIDVYARAHVYVDKAKSVTMRHCQGARTILFLSPGHSRIPPGTPGFPRALPDSRGNLGAAWGLTYFSVSSKVAEG